MDHAKYLEEIEASLQAYLNETAELDVTNIESAIYKYVKMRDALSAIRKRFDLFETTVKSIQETINVYMLQKGQELGVESFKTEMGTAYKVVKTSYRCENWEEFSSWILESGNIQCVEKRPAKLACEEVSKETGVSPPGLTKFVEVEFQVRRGKGID